MKDIVVYEYRDYSFKKDNNDKLITWKSIGIDNLSVNSDFKAISNSTLLLPSLENNGRINVKFEGNYFLQNNFVIYYYIQIIIM